MGVLKRKRTLACRFVCVCILCMRACVRTFVRACMRARARVCACAHVRMCFAAHVLCVQRAHVHRRRCSWQPLPHAHVAPAFCCLASSRFTDVTCITCHSQSISHRHHPCSMLLVQSVCNFSGNCVVRCRYTCSSSHTGAVEVLTPLPFTWNFESCNYFTFIPQLYQVWDCRSWTQLARVQVSPFMPIIRHSPCLMSHESFVFCSCCRGASLL